MRYTGDIISAIYPAEIAPYWAISHQYPSKAASHQTRRSRTGFNHQIWVNHPNQLGTPVQSRTTMNNQDELAKGGDSLGLAIIKFHEIHGDGLS
jgi:hypothetical protein